MKISTIQKLAWLYAIMFFFLGTLAHIPWINDEHGVTLGIFSLQWYDDLLHYASGVWAAIAAWRSCGLSLRRLASSVAAASVSRFLRPPSASAYLLAITSPCSVRRIRPF